MKKRLVWRLGKLPTPDELRELVKDKIVTHEEARDILFNLETEEERDKNSLEAEIKFLRELVEKLSQNQTQRIVEVIREVKVPYYKYGWYRPYDVWCTGTSTAGALLTATSGSTTLNTIANADFSSIKTF